MTKLEADIREAILKELDCGGPVRPAPGSYVYKSHRQTADRLTPVIAAICNTRTTPAEPSRDALVEAATALLADVRRRHPGEELRCEYMRALDAALKRDAQ